MRLSKKQKMQALAVAQTKEMELLEQNETAEGILTVSSAHQNMLSKEYCCLEQEFSGADCLANHIMFGLHQLSRFLVQEHAKKCQCQPKRPSFKRKR